MKKNLLFALSLMVMAAMLLAACAPAATPAPAAPAEPAAPAVEPTKAPGTRCGTHQGSRSPCGSGSALAHPPRQPG